MTLKQVTKELETVMDELSAAFAVKAGAEEKYFSRYFELLLTSHATDAARREAEAKQILRTDNAELYNLYLDAKLRVVTLVNRKELLIEISRNLRGGAKE